MGVFWNSEGEILTRNKDRCLEINDFIQNIDVKFEDFKIYKINIDKCSIRFGSNGYGSYETLFDKICNNFKFPIFCHERVIPCQGQEYGFFHLCGRWIDGSVKSYTEKVYKWSSGDEPNDDYADSAQILNIPTHLLSKKNQYISEKRRNELIKILENASKKGTPITDSAAWYDSEEKLYYLNDFIDNCHADDEDKIYEIFDEELIKMCTWNRDLSIMFIDDEGEETINLPEKINYENLRLSI